MNDPVDLSGMTITAQLRTTQISFPFDVLVLNPAAGTGLLTMSSEQTGSIPARAYTSDVEFAKDGFVTSSMSFPIRVYPDVSQPSVALPAPATPFAGLPSFDPTGVTPFHVVNMIDGGKLEFYPSHILELTGTNEVIYFDGEPLFWNQDYLTFAAA